VSNNENQSQGNDYPATLEAFSFEQWCQLHENDPDRFDACRLKLLNDLVDAAPRRSQSRLRGLMFTMAGESRRAKSAEGYNMKLGLMMMSKLEELQGELVSFGSGNFTNNTQSVSAKVIPFQKNS